MIWNWLTGKRRRLRREQRRQKAIAALDGIRSLRIRQGETRERNLQRREEFLKEWIQRLNKRVAEKQNHPYPLRQRGVRMETAERRLRE